MPDTRPLCTSCSQPLAAGRRLSLCPACLSKGWQRAKADEPAAATGFEIPGYEILDELARGGMSVVYRARQRSPQREVAVKMLMPQVSLDDMRERFRIEAKVMADLVHPGIIPIYQYGEHTGVPWISMALCGKGSLALRKGEYAGQWRRIAELMAKLAEAVAFAHVRGVLHRDLKPGNVLFDDEGRVFLSDFGLAKIVSEHSDLTRTISLVGTPHYLAPELVNNASQATTASDVYALGAILYELLAGKVPFDGQNVAAILKQISDDDPAPLARDVPRDLRTIAFKCLNKTPAQRYDSAQSLADDLKRWLASEPIAARRMSATERLVLWCKRKPALAAMAALLVLATLGSTVLILAKNRDLSTALHESREVLRAALLTQIRHTRMSARMQDRDTALDAVRRAAALYTTPELEEEAASLLALTSLEETHVIGNVSSRFAFVPDEQIQRALDFTDPLHSRVVALPSRQTLAELGDGRGSGSRHPFSPDGRLVVFIDDQTHRLVVKDWAASTLIAQAPDEKARHQACFSPDGRTLACGLDNGGVELYDLTAPPDTAPKTWPPFGRLPARPAGYSPDGRWLAVYGSSHQVTILDAATGVAKCTLGLAEDGTTQSAEWFPDSTGLLIGGLYGKVRGWSISAQGSAGRALPSHAAQVYGMAVHPHGQLAITSAYDSQSFFIDWPSGRALGSDTTSSNTARFSIDGRLACLYNEKAKQMRIFEVRTSAVCRQYAAPEKLADIRMGKGSWATQISPDGRVVAMAEYGWISFFDRVTSRYLGRVTGPSGNTLHWSRQGRELLAAKGRALLRFSVSITDDHTLHVKALPDIPLQGQGAYRICVAEAADRWIATMGDGVCIGRLSSDDTEFIPLPSYIPAADVLNLGELSADGRWVSGSAEKSGKVSVLDLESKKWVKNYKTDISAHLWFAPDSRSCWIGAETYLSHITLPDFKVTKARHDRREPGGAALMDGSSDARLLATFDGQSICLRHGDTGEPFLWLRHPIALPSAWIEISTNGRWLIYSALGHVMQIWDLAKLETEMQKLGLPWRGPHLEIPPDPPPLTRLVVE